MDTLFLLVVVFRSISKSSKVQLYIIIMKPFIEVAGGNHLPAICHAREEEWHIWEIIIIVKNIGRAIVRIVLPCWGKEAEG